MNIKFPIYLLQNRYKQFNCTSIKLKCNTVSNLRVKLLQALDL